MIETKTIEEELDERHAIARAAFLNRDVAAYRALFSPALAYHQINGRVIDRRKLMRDVASQFRRRLDAKWHYTREHLKIDLDEAAETLVQVVTVEMSVFGLIHRTWQLNRRAVYFWTKLGGVWTIGRVQVLSEEGKHLGWRFGVMRR
ncbi:DUF4440 domain-containing protein [Rhizobium sp. SG570]|uniref:DUF4440 domain-containing protein n=1 Tax=Rhizobium sp. SG570 TaxID=2587113 RepID=UPI0017CA0138|nr:DUF4440 domain-containing protein [Rhizobium sp. SG570]NKJ40354.1 hypothetical protein [Rhizobium sp. SG570]